MSKEFVTEEDIYAATNNGFDIIADLYPDASDCLYKPKKKFKRRDEKTASAKVNQSQTGTYFIYDFGTKEKISPIKAYMEERRVDWPTAMNELAARYNVKPETIKKIEAKFSIRAATADEVEGTYYWEKKDKFEDFEIEYIFSSKVLWHHGFYNNLADPEEKQKKKEAAYNKLRSTLSYYNYFALKSYTYIKNGKALTFASHSQYPIYIIDEGTHQKIYEPKADKKFRFKYSGTVPKDFLHGLTQLTRDYNKRKADQEAGQEDKKENADRGQETPASSVKLKVPKLIIVSGGSDALNAAAIGYQVLWPNSESAEITPYQWKDLTFKAEKIYQLMDIDATGVQQAHKRAMEYLDLHTIELPKELLQSRDNRGYQRKDLRDFLDLYKPEEFDKLVDDALPYRFWDERYKYNKQGEFVGIDYDFNNVHAYNFLQKVGFFRLPIGSQTNDFLYIQITDNIVEETNPIDIKDYIKQFLRKKRAEVALRNAIFRTTQLSESSLTNLDRIQLEFKDYTETSQFFFFKNKTIEVTGSGIIESDPKASTRFVWAREVHDHFLKLRKKPSFTIKKDAVGAYDIEIHDYECQFLRYLIQVSRVHWRTELETNLDTADMTPVEKEAYKETNRYRIDGPLLSPEEIDEQKKHLINKIFAIGYLMHRYKNGARAWMVLGMDAKISTDGKSHGGSGKSLLFTVAMDHLLKSTFQLPGRANKLDQNDFKYDGLTEHHRYIFIEDAHQYLPYDMFYTDITGNISVNPKGKQPFSIPFEKAGKMAMTTNYTPTNLSPSTERRLLYTAFSDYYHVKSASTDYRESRDPASEFGMRMFEGWDEIHWNNFYNTAIECLRFYLSTDGSEKLEPAMNNVNIRNLLSGMGPNFYDWACIYFSEESDKLNTFLIRHEVYKDYEYHNPSPKLGARSWFDKLKMFCRLMGYDLNPLEYQDKRGSIIQKVDEKVYDARTNTWTVVNGPKVSKEMMFVRTHEFLANQEAEERKPASLPSPTDPAIKIEFPENQTQPDDEDEPDPF